MLKNVNIELHTQSLIILRMISIISVIFTVNINVYMKIIKTKIKLFLLLTNVLSH